MPSDARKPLRSRLKELYFGSSERAIRFQAIWLVFDIALISFFLAAPFMERGPLFLVIDYVIAAILAIDLAARAWGYGAFARWIRRPIVLADIAVLASLIAPAYAANLGFLRIMRAYSLIHGNAFWRVLGGGRWKDTPVAETTKAIVNLAVFIFMMASLVHGGFAARVPEINSFIDSLYFTVTTLSTTGYGDITLPGAWGKLVSIIIMIGGVSLFFRLVQVTMRASKVRHPCPVCGLVRHDADAVHCKACGELLNIRHDND